MQVKDYYRLCFALVDNSSVYNSALDHLKSSEVLQNKSGFNWYTWYNCVFYWNVEISAWRNMEEKANWYKVRKYSNPFHTAHLKKIALLSLICSTKVYVRIHTIQKLQFTSNSSTKYGSILSLLNCNTSSKITKTNWWKRARKIKGFQ